MRLLRRSILYLVKRLNFLFSDKNYISIQYHLIFHKKLNLSNPITYNEKLNWLKLYDHQQDYIRLVDKIAVKDWVSDKIGKEYVIPILGIWDNVDDIDWKQLPDKFVLKTNHDGSSHGVVVCKDKTTFDKKNAIRVLRRSMAYSSYGRTREWPYKHIERKVFAEAYLEDQYGELWDYKFFCFNGVVRALFIATERSSGDVKFDYYDADFNHLDLRQVHPMATQVIERPKSFELMKQLAACLSKGIPQVRVDFYEVNGKPYFGEMTFFHHGGMVPFHPEKWDEIFGSWIDLSTVKR